MTLTAKQAVQVAKAPPARKATVKASFARQAPVAKQKQPKNRIVGVPRTLGFAFDAFDKRHMPLDELTAPYTTTNFINIMEFGSSVTMDQVIVICPRLSAGQPQESHVGPLTDFIAMRYDAAETIDGTISTLQETRCPIINAPNITDSQQYSSVRARLHNLSVKLECLGTNTGLYPPGSAYIGTVPVIETGNKSGGAEHSLTIRQAWAEDSMSVGYIKSKSAALLVNEPAYADAAVAENVSYKSWRDFRVPAAGTDWGSLPFSTALEPIVIYVPRTGAGTTVVNYRIVIGQQWCSRHPHNVMLRSTQKQHPATASGDWNRALSAVKNVGEHMLERAGSYAVDAISTRFQQAVNPGRPVLMDRPLVVD